MKDETKIQLRKCMLRDKAFLKSLYLSNSLSNKTTLSFAQRTEILTLIKVLFFLARGEIPLKRAHYKNLIKSKKTNVLTSMSSVKEAKRVKNAYPELNSIFMKRKKK